MVDLVVRGAGVLGLTVAWEAAKRGLKVCIIDPNGIASTASGGIAVSYTHLTLPTKQPV